MTSTDHDAALAAAYADLGRPVAPTEDPVAAVRSLMRRRARRRRTISATVAACVLAVALVGTLQVFGRPSPDAASSSATGGEVAAPTGALPAAGAASCAIGYHRRTLRERDWAVDATVTGIGVGTSTVNVALDVHTWFHGGSGTRLNVAMPAPERSEDAPPSYAVGTRLLVSGAGADGDRTGWSCGFTRYYDPRTAAVWAEVFRR